MWAIENGIEVNLDKSAVIGSQSIGYNSKYIKEVTSYKYLGIEFNHEGLVVENTFDILHEKAESIIKLTSMISFFLSEEERIQIFKTYLFQHLYASILFQAMPYKEFLRTV